MQLPEERQRAGRGLPVLLPAPLPGDLISHRHLQPAPDTDPAARGPPLCAGTASPGHGSWHTVPKQGRSKELSPSTTAEHCSQTTAASAGRSPPEPSGSPEVRVTKGIKESKSQTVQGRSWQRWGPRPGGAMRSAQEGLRARHRQHPGGAAPAQSHTGPPPKTASLAGGALSLPVQRELSLPVTRGGWNWALRHLPSPAMPGL